MIINENLSLQAIKYDLRSGDIFYTVTFIPIKGRTWSFGISESVISKRKGTYVKAGELNMSSEFDTPTLLHAVNRLKIWLDLKYRPLTIGNVTTF